MSMTKKIVIVLTSHDRLGSTGEKTGFWLEELATPYYVFADAGLEIELVSPRGSAAPYDPKSLDREANRPASVTRFLADRDAMARVERTTPLASVRAEGVSALFIAGGHGTMWDLPTSDELASLVGRLFDRGAVIGAVCHGPAGLTAARAQNGSGRSILDGKRATCFTNAEEEAIRLTQVVPFLLETRLRDLGANVSSAAMWQPHAVLDGNLVTGQNPQSSEKTARLMLEALG
jgi:putative intracellular protease/amidase